MSDLSDDIREAIELAIPDDLDGWRERYTDKAASNVMAAIAAATDWDRLAVASEIRTLADEAARLNATLNLALSASHQHHRDTTRETRIEWGVRYDTHPDPATVFPVPSERDARALASGGDGITHAMYREARLTNWTEAPK